MAGFDNDASVGFRDLPVSVRNDIRRIDSTERLEAIIFKEHFVYSFLIWQWVEFRLGHNCTHFGAIYHELIWRNFAGWFRTGHTYPVIEYMFPYSALDIPIQRVAVLRRIQVKKGGLVAMCPDLVGN